MGESMVNIEWKEHGQVLSSGLWNYVLNEYMVDTNVTFAGECLKVHRLILSIFLPTLRHYFNVLTSMNTNNSFGEVNMDFLATHTSDVQTLVEFTYNGRASVSEDRIEHLLRLAESLQFEGLTKAIGQCRPMMQNYETSSVAANDETFESSVVKVEPDTMDFDDAFNSCLEMRIKEEPKDDYGDNPPETNCYNDYGDDQLTTSHSIGTEKNYEDDPLDSIRIHCPACEYKTLSNPIFREHMKTQHPDYALSNTKKQNFKKKNSQKQNVKKTSVSAVAGIENTVNDNHPSETCHVERPSVPNAYEWNREATKSCKPETLWNFDSDTITSKDVDKANSIDETYESIKVEQDTNSDKTLDKRSSENDHEDNVSTRITTDSIEENLESLNSQTSLSADSLLYITIQTAQQLQRKPRSIRIKTSSQEKSAVNVNDTYETGGQRRRRLARQRLQRWRSKQVERCEMDYREKCRIQSQQFRIKRKVTETIEQREKRLEKLRIQKRRYREAKIIKKSSSTTTEKDDLDPNPENNGI